MAAGEKKAQIVIKKITVVSGGAHGGAWKVAFADFMTAMMAFFLVMWLVNSASQEEKKAISDYFSTPSVIEYQFQNFGAELTLEKLFVDLINEPLKTLQSLVTPADRTPNMLQLGTKKVVMAYMADQLGSMASNVEVTADSVVFEIPDSMVFEFGTATPTAGFVTMMERVKGVTMGLEDSNVSVTSVVFTDSVRGREMLMAKQVSEQRLDLIQTKVKAGIESESVDLNGKAIARPDDRKAHENQAGGGFIRFEIRQKTVLPDGKKPRKIQDGMFGAADPEKNVYDNFVDQVSKTKKRQPASKQ
ncbi:MAG: flagellar motor protein MotB [Bdellovibrionota bacterium]